MRVLLIDDDAELCAMMGEVFAQCGHVLETARDGRSGLRRAREGSHDAVLLDVMLPAIDGFSVLHHLRRGGASVPVIMLTARTDRDDRIAGLAGGADDHVVKPFDPDELMARIGAVLRRGGARPGEPLRRLGEITIDVPARTVTLAGAPVGLTGLEFDFLELLTRQPGRALSRDEISHSLLGRAASPYDRALDVHVSHLRDKLKARTLIRTVRGLGYVFAVEAGA